jgi:hypothetical protein
MQQQTGAELIAAERKRQIEKEGYSATHDDMHEHSGQLAAAAITYADTALIQQCWTPDAHEREITDAMVSRWPWEEEAFKPAPEPIRNLVKAGALIAAEIDRLQRIQRGTAAQAVIPTP